MPTPRPLRIQVYISEEDLITLTQEGERQLRKATNLAAAIISEKCQQIREQNDGKATIL